MNGIECSAVEAEGHDSPEAPVLSFVAVRSPHVVVSIRFLHFSQHIAQTLHSTLVATFLDCAPTVFSLGSTPSEVETQLVVTVAQIIHTLYEPILQLSLAGGLPHFHLASSDRIRSGQTKRCRQFVEPYWLYDSLLSIDGRYGWQGDFGCKVNHYQSLTF